MPKLDLNYINRCGKQHTISLDLYLVAAIAGVLVGVIIALIIGV